MQTLILIRALTTGGAERQAALLAKGLQARGHSTIMMVFYGGGSLEDDLTASGVRLINLEKKGRWDSFAFLWRLLRTLRQERPKIVYSFLTGSNLLTGLLKPWLPGSKVVWGLRASNMDPTRYDWLIRLTVGLERRLAGRADLIIANSQSGHDHAIAMGFPADRLRVVRNGINTQRFGSDRATGTQLRVEWGVSTDQPLIGLVARLDPMKGHLTFFTAAAKLKTLQPDVRFVCVGDGPDHYRAKLMAETRRLGLEETLLWVGDRQDMPAVYNALDLAVSASLFGEGVSNMLGEAMACGTPCVTTAVGDSAWLVGDTGIVVPPGDAATLAEAIASQLKRLTTEGDLLRQAARQRIQTHLSVDALLDNTLHAFEELR